MAALLDPPPRPGATAALHALLEPLQRLDALLLRAAGEAPDAAVPQAPPGGALAWLARAYDLSQLDLDVVTLALAPELDRRYAGLYAQLQGSPSSQLPSVDLALALLCPGPFERADARSRFAADAPLARVLLPPAGPPRSPAAPLLTRAVVLEPQIVRLLLDERGIDPRIEFACELLPAAEAPDARVEGALAEALAGEVRARLLITGPSAAARRRAGQSAAGLLGRPLLRVDAARLAEAADASAPLVRLAAREARFLDAVLAVDDAQALWAHRVDGALADAPPVTVIAAVNSPRTGAWSRELADVRRLDAPLPDARERRAAWKRELAAAGSTAAGDAVAAAAGRFTLDDDDIAHAVAALPRGTRVAPRALLEAARARAGIDLAGLASRVELVHEFDDLVLPPDRLEQLEELCRHIAHRPRVYEDWGFAARHGRASGVTVLFSGPPGTGKTMAAAVVARRLGLDLCRIDLASVVSKYIGETEQNLDRVFAAAEHSNAILLFDEADALFGRRTATRDAHDRYANLEVSYLLQRIESYDGVAILASNLRKNIDEAFTRRMRFAIEFPVPGEPERRRIWEGVWPQRLPLDEDVDAARLAARFDLAGGGIRNVAVASAFLAAADGGRVTMEHVLHAVRREYEKTRRIISDADFAAEVPR